MGAPNTSAERIPEIVQALEEDILLGRLYPRERLVEEQLAQRFDASRHVVRQALATLDEAGLIARTSGKGAVVAEYSVEEVAELYQLREYLESQAARQIELPLNPTDLAAIDAIAQAYAAAVAALDMQAVIRCNKAFHQAVYATCGNRFLAMTIDQMAQRANLIRFSTSTDPAFLAQARDEHFGIVDALRKGEREALLQRCVAHLQPAKQRYLQLRVQRT